MAAAIQTVRRPALRHLEGDDGGGRGEQQRGEAQRDFEPPRRNQPQSGDERAGDGRRGVDAGEPADLCRDGAILSRDRGHGERPDRTECRGHRQHHGGDRQRLPPDDGSECRVRRGDEIGDDERELRRGEARQQAGGGRTQQRSADHASGDRALRQAAADRGSDRDAGDERRHHRRERERRRPDGDRQDPRPDELQRHRRGAAGSDGRGRRDPVARRWRTRCRGLARSSMRPSS